MLGYGYISAYFIVFNLLKRKYEDKKIRISLLILSILFGSFFVFTLSLTRFILYQISYLFLNPNPIKLDLPFYTFQFCIQHKYYLYRLYYLFFCSLYPSICTEHKWIVQKMVFNKHVLFICFRKSILFRSCCLIYFESCMDVYSCWECFIPNFVTLKIPSLTIHYAPQYVFILAFIVVYIQCLKHLNGNI